MENKQEIKIGDIFKPKPTTHWYQGQTLRVFKIRFTDRPPNEHRIDCRCSGGGTDSFWRERFFGRIRKI